MKVGGAQQNNNQQTTTQASKKKNKEPQPGEGPNDKCDPRSDLSCGGGTRGKCVLDAPTASYKCQCNAIYHGEQCGKYECPGHDEGTPCSGNGNCNDELGLCICKVSWAKNVKPLNRKYQQARTSQKSCGNQTGRIL